MTLQATLFRNWRLQILFSALFFSAFPSYAVEDLPVETLPDVRDSIVKIYTVQNQPDYYNPWSMQGMRSATGSGSIIEGKKILTNAHVVSDETFIQVRRYGEFRRYQAQVVRVSHDADLAVLRVEDESFFEDAVPLSLGELPDSQDEVLVYGFPMGGDTLSITKGVISRIEHQTYAHSSFSLLAGQIDAAINPGNSGGPVLQDGRIVGVAMQGISNAENLGYMVPVNVIRHFLKDIEDDRYDGFPSLGIAVQNMENPGHRKAVGMSSGDSGVLITRVLLDSAADGLLQEGDVLLQIDGVNVADDGTVEFRPRERTSLSYLIQERQIGESIQLLLLRDGNRKELLVELDRPVPEDWLIPMEQYDSMPSYYIYGGVVFCPLTKNLMMRWGNQWYNGAPKEWMALLNQNMKTRERDEVVIALQVLAADVNQGYHNYRNWMVEKVDGQTVRNLKDLIEKVEASDQTYVEFSSSSGSRVVLERKTAEESLPAILERYRIPQDRSDDLRPPLLLQRVAVEETL